MMGAVTTLLPFTGWLITDRGTVIRAGSLPWRSRRTREEFSREAAANMQLNHSA